MIRYLIPLTLFVGLSWGQEPKIFYIETDNEETWFNKTHLMNDISDSSTNYHTENSITLSFRIIDQKGYTKIAIGENALKVMRENFDKRKNKLENEQRQDALKEQFKTNLQEQGISYSDDELEKFFKGYFDKEKVEKSDSQLPAWFPDLIDKGLEFIFLDEFGFELLRMERLIDDNLLKNKSIEIQEQGDVKADERIVLKNTHSIKVLFFLRNKTFPTF